MTNQAFEDARREFGVIDTMINLPSGSKRDWYKFLEPQLHDQSKDYEFPVEYMFKEVPDDLPEAREERGDEGQCL